MSSPREVTPVMRSVAQDTALCLMRSRDLFRRIGDERRAEVCEENVRKLGKLFDFEVIKQ